MAAITTFEELKAYAEENFPASFSKLPPASAYRVAKGHPEDPNAIALWIGQALMSRPSALSHDSLADSNSSRIFSKCNVFAKINRESNEVDFIMFDSYDREVEAVSFFDPFSQIRPPVSDGGDGMWIDDVLEVFVRYCFEVNGHYGGLDMNTYLAFEEACERIAGKSKPGSCFQIKPNNLRSKNARRRSMKILSSKNFMTPVPESKFADGTNDQTSNPSSLNMIKAVRRELRTEMPSAEATKGQKGQEKDKLTAEKETMAAEKTTMATEKARLTAQINTLQATINELRAAKHTTDARLHNLDTVLEAAAECARRKRMADQDEIAKWRDAYYSLKEGLQNLTTVDHLAPPGQSTDAVNAGQDRDNSLAK